MQLELEDVLWFRYAMLTAEYPCFIVEFMPGISVYRWIVHRFLGLVHVITSLFITAFQ